MLLSFWLSIRRSSSSNSGASVCAARTLSINEATLWSDRVSAWLRAGKSEIRKKNGCEDDAVECQLWLTLRVMHGCSPYVGFRFLCPEVPRD